MPKQFLYDKHNCSDLAVPFEENVFESVMNWVKHELGCRKHFLPFLLEHVRLPLNSKPYDCVSIRQFSRRVSPKKPPTNYKKAIHFEQSQFEKNHAVGWKKLKPNAVLTLFNVPNPPTQFDIVPSQKCYIMFIKIDYCSVHAIEHNAMMSIIDDGAPATNFTDHNFFLFQ